MNNFFYCKLAVTNLQKHKNTYAPYILTCIGAIIMFYNALALTGNTSMHGSVQEMMVVASTITGFFSALFLFYTNSFLIKRRKKEFGLFNLLGMEKKHIAKIMLWENLIVSALSIAGGLTLGVIFNKLITLVLYKILHYDPNLAFEFTARPLLLTAMLFACIFLLTLISNILQVKKARPAELLMGGNTGEKEPRAKLLVTASGIITLGLGYGIALTITNPLQALPMFFMAAVFVIIGTYCLFTSGSISLLKLLKKNQGYYYKTNHFTSVSSMMHRMKQNAAGLASICIMSTAVLIMISTTVSMYLGMEDLLSNRYPKDFFATVTYTPETQFAPSALSDGIEQIIAGSGKRVSDYSNYSYMSFSTRRNGNNYVKADGNYIGNDENFTLIIAMTVPEYTRLTGSRLSLSQSEIALWSERSPDSVTVLNQPFTVTKQLQELPVMGERIAWMVDIVYMVVADEDTLNALYTAQQSAYGDEASKLQYEVSFNLIMAEDEKTAYTADILTPGIREKFDGLSYDWDSKQLSRTSFFEVYGSLLFLGLFLGTLFLMATVLIIYYKQIVEGFEDKQRFEIMQKVGMSRAEVKRSINSQILTVFTLPLAVAVLHIVVAFPILTKLLNLLNMTNIPLFALCIAATTLVFAVIYLAVYLMTAKVYFKIVHS